MPSTLVFPDGIRLARKDEIPGPERDRSKTWPRVESANIVPGYVLHATEDKRFMHYAEINVNAPQIWPVFRDLCQALLSPHATFIAAETDCELIPIGSACTFRYRNARTSPVSIGARRVRAVRARERPRRNNQ